MKPRIRAVYLSTMWPPLGQGGEELTNLENFEILRDILDIQVADLNHLANEEPADAI